MSRNSSRLLFLRALTPVHAGFGRGFGEISGLIDLPVQRDEFGFPCIWSSSFKGALRASAARTAKGDACFNFVFGPEPESPEVSEYSSAASFLDARLLFMPARSLKGIWTYITSPHLLGYLVQYLEVVGRDTPQQLASLGMRLPVSSTSRVVVKNGIAVINEVGLRVHVNENLVDQLFQDVLPQELLDKLKSHGLIIVDDDSIRSMVQRSLLVQFRVRLHRETKTVDVGPWSEEYLPEETILVSGIVCRPLSGRAAERCGREPCKWLEELIKSKLNGALWLGGKETIGRGFIKLYIA